MCGVETKERDYKILTKKQTFTIVKSVFQQHHTSEYGVHWNFFFTLAAVTLASEAVTALVGGVARARLGLGK